MERKEIRWRRHATVEQVQYEDGTGDLCNLTYKEPEGLEIVGNGSLQAPLTVRVKAGWSLVRDQAGEGEVSGANPPATLPAGYSVWAADDGDWWVTPPADVQLFSEPGEPLLLGDPGMNKADAEAYAADRIAHILKG